MCQGGTKLKRRFGLLGKRKTRPIHRGQVRVTAVFQRADQRTLHVRKATRPEGQHLKIRQALDIDTQPGGNEKLIHWQPTYNMPAL